MTGTRPDRDPVAEQTEVGQSSAVPTEPDVASDPTPTAGAARRSRRRAVAIWSLRVVAVVVALAVLAAFVPVSSSDLDARAEPTTDYDAAIARFDAATADESSQGVIDACRSQRLVHGERTEVAVVLFHGLTNCPKQFVEFAEHLHDDGANVIVMRAPHHGLGDGGVIGDVSKVGPLSAEELRDFADESVDIAAGLGDRVEVLGLSMGGVLAMWTAQFRSDVDRVVAVAPAISIPRVPHLLTTGFVNLANRLPDFSLPSAGSKLDHAYAGESTGALAAMFLLARANENEISSSPAAADQVTVVLNPDDDQVDNGEVRQLVERWQDGDGEVEIVELPATGLPHDVIDPDQPDADVDAVYPALFELLEAGRPDA